MRTTVFKCSQNGSTSCPITRAQSQTRNMSASYTYEPETTFTPDFGKGQKIECTLCKEKQLAYAGQGFKKAEHEYPCLLPCGHFFGHHCLQTWLKDNDTCPSCRFLLRHPGCNHTISGFQVRHWNYKGKIPKLLEEGGRIHDDCWPCRGQKVHKAAQDLLAMCEQLAAMREEERVFAGAGLSQETDNLIHGAQQVLEYALKPVHTNPW